MDRQGLPGLVRSGGRDRGAWLYSAGMAAADGSKHFAEFARAAYEGNGIVPLGYVARLVAEHPMVAAAIAGFCQVSTDPAVAAFGNDVITVLRKPVPKREKPARVSARAVSGLRLVGGAR